MNQKELEKLIESLKMEIADDCRAFENDDEPGIQLTIACDDPQRDSNGRFLPRDIVYQTGDNTFSGACYHVPHWAVAGVYRTTEADELAADMLRDLGDTVAASREF